MRGGIFIQGLGLWVKAAAALRQFFFSFFCVRGSERFRQLWRPVLRRTVRKEAMSVPGMDVWESTASIREVAVTPEVCTITGFSLTSTIQATSGRSVCGISTRPWTSSTALSWMWTSCGRLCRRLWRRRAMETSRPRSWMSRNTGFSRWCWDV